RLASAVQLRPWPPSFQRTYAESASLRQSAISPLSLPFNSPRSQVTVGTQLETRLCFSVRFQSALSQQNRMTDSIPGSSHKRLPLTREVAGSSPVAPALEEIDSNVGLLRFREKPGNLARHFRFRRPLKSLLCRRVDSNLSSLCSLA